MECARALFLIRYTCWHEHSSAVTDIYFFPWGRSFKSHYPNLLYLKKNQVNFLLNKGNDMGGK